MAPAKKTSKKLTISSPITPGPKTITDSRRIPKQKIIKIEELCRDQNLSEAQIANIVNVSQTTVQRYKSRVVARIAADKRLRKKDGSNDPKNQEIEDPSTYLIGIKRGFVSTD